MGHWIIPRREFQYPTGEDTALFNHLVVCGIPEDDIESDAVSTGIFAADGLCS